MLTILEYKIYVGNDIDIDNADICGTNKSHASGKLTRIYSNCLILCFILSKAFNDKKQ